jgi:hypothetical protein
MADKDAIKRKRGSALRANLGIEPDDRIDSMISRQDGLYAVSLDKIIRVNLPNDIDPEIEHEDAPIAQTLVATKGSRSPIIARTILQAEDFSKFLSGQEPQRQMQDIAWEVMLSLLSIERLVTGIRASIDAKCAEILPKYSNYAEGSSPPPPPIVQDLEIDFRSVVLLANHTLNSISELFTAVFEINIKRGAFDRIAKWATKTFGEDDPLAQMLRADEKWINIWGEIRNALEHPKEDYYVRVNNFSLLANRQIQLPTWQLKHQHFDLFRPQALIDTVESLQNNILGLFENLLVSLTERAADLSRFCLIDKDEQDRDPNRPKRYELIPARQTSSP